MTGLSAEASRTTATSPVLAHAGTKRSHIVTDEPSPQRLPSSNRNRNHLDNDYDDDDEGGSSAPAVSHQTPSTAYATFRNVSACNRCRLRKNRCDQRLPRCRACEKAGVHCVGYDPTTKREIPRSYTFYLESRVAYLEKLLTDHHIAFRPGEAHEGEKDSGRRQNRDGAGASENNDSLEEADESHRKDGGDSGRAKLGGDGTSVGRESEPEKRRSADSERKLDNLVSNIGMVSVQGASDPRYLGSTSGISFARVFFAALRSSALNAGSGSDRGSVRASDRRPSMGSTTTTNGGGGSSMRDSFFGLQTRPTMKRAPFPDRELAERLVNLYFEHANPQLPILHREEFMELLETVYSDEPNRSPRDMYLLFIVCAIGAGVIFETKDDSDSEDAQSPENPPSPSDSMPSPKRRRVSTQQRQPEEYHASAVVHLESFLCSGSNMDGSGSGGGGGLDELQAVLLLASFAVLRPVSPGLWYIVGVAVRLAVDLGLHHEDGTGIDHAADDNNEVTSRTIKSGRDDGVQNYPSGVSHKPTAGPRERGWREWICDFRRRLFWCTYSFDRIVSTCIGRPFGIADEVITTAFPSCLDDKYITKSGFVVPPSHDTPSYKKAAHHYFKLRLLQSEIQQVLQYQHAKMARRPGHRSHSDSYLRTNLPSPFLQDFDSFRSWRLDIHRRLIDWRNSAPTSEDIGVRFPVEFLELNYWQALITLYRQSLTVPAALANELSPSDDISSPTLTGEEEREDEDDTYLKVAEAGQKVLRLYRQLHCLRLVNYTYLATHHLFMAGVSFLYAIWHSPLVRVRLTFDDVDFTVYSAVSVLSDLMEKCPPAEACRDAFDRMSKATIKMCLSTTGFGPNVEKNAPQGTYFSVATQNLSSSQNPQTQHLRDEQLKYQRREGGVDSDPPGRGLHGSCQVPTSKGQSWDDMQLDSQSDNVEQTVHQYSTSRQHQFSGADSHLLRMSQQSNYNNFYPSSQHEPNATQYQPSDPFESPQQQHQQPYPTPQTTTTPQQPLQILDDLSELDFLDFASTYPALHQSSPYNNENNDVPTTGSSNQNQHADVDFMSPMQSFDPSRPSGSGMDFRFGAGPDLQHDWSHGGGIDLFDGLFFGTGGGFNGYGV